MPTARAVAFLSSALLLYFFANQTQVGWIYVMSAVMGGTVLAAWWLGRAALRGISVQRAIWPAQPPHEGEPVAVQLTFHNTRWGAHIRTTEHCPFADPNSHRHRISIFIPALPANAPVQYRYDLIADRRGLHEFPPLALESPAPFGLFRRKRGLPAPTRYLIYPEVRPLRSLALLDRRPSMLLSRPRPGPGAEFLGLRPFRAGDSPRHVHWRSVARTGYLISKEFADDSQPGLTVALDLTRRAAAPNPPGKVNPKHSPFEYAVKIAASVGDYAMRRGYAMHLLADPLAWAPPPGPLSRTALLEYLARVQPDGESSFADLVSAPPPTQFLVCILPHPDDSVAAPLLALQQRGLEVLAVCLHPASFPGGGPSAERLVASLTAGGLEARSITFDADWATQLAGEASAPVNPLDAAAARSTSC